MGERREGARGGRFVVAGVLLLVGAGAGVALTLAFRDVGWQVLVGRVVDPACGGATG